VRDLVQTARAAALAGAAVLRERAQEQGARRTKSASTDFVTDADIASGVAIVRAIAAARPSAVFVVEEAEVYDEALVPLGRLDADEVWVIDPLDGTTSYIHGFPCFSVSVACVRNGRPVAGAVYDVARQEMYSAAEGTGAERDGVSVTVASAEMVSDALMVTGFPYDRGEALDRQLAVLSAFLHAPVHGIRRDGSAAIDCCHVASGRADGFWEYGLKPWDMAAGAVILREAGALVTDISGRPWDIHSESLCTANPVLHARMLEVIRGAAGS